MNKPKPRPPWVLLSCENFRNSFSRSCPAIPGPVSVTATMTWVWSRVAANEIVPPDGVNLIAFPTKELRRILQEQAEVRSFQAERHLSMRESFNV